MSEKKRCVGRRKDSDLLYELALAVGNSLDLKEMCHLFLKRLLTLKNLEFAACWIKNEYLLDKKDKTFATLISAQPESRIKDTAIPINHPLFELSKARGFFSISSADDNFSQFITEKGIEKGTLSIFALEDLGILKLYGMTKKTPFEEREVNQLKEIMRKFASSIQICLLHERVKKEITEDKQSDEALKLYQFMIESAQDAIFFKDLESRYRVANDAALKAFGLSGQEVIGKNDYELMPDYEEAKINVEDDQYVFKTGKIAEITTHMTDVSGKTRWFQAIKTPHYDETGKIVGLVGIARDITDRKMMEEEIRQHRDHLEELVAQRTEELRESEQKYYTIFETTGTAIVIIEEDTTLAMVNLEFEKLSGYSKQELEGKKSWTEFVVKEDLEKMKEYHDARRKEPEFAPRNYEFRFLDRYGQIKHIYLTVAMIPGTKKTVASLLDITERKQIEEELRRVEKLAVAAQIASEAAHEVKNPLTVIKSGLYYLKKILPQEQEDAQKTILQMDKATNRATTYINDLLDLSKPPLFCLGPVEINEVIEQTIKEIPQEILSDIELVTDFEDNLPLINTDGERLKQVLTNLIKNASEAMMEVRNKRLKIRTKKEEGFIQIDISDTGKGIAEENIRYIFDPFFTTKGKGTGLGLAICQRFIEALKGEIKVVTKVDEGTTFILKLPR